MLLKYFHRCSWCQRILAEGPEPIKTFIMCHACRDEDKTRREYSELTGASGGVNGDVNWDYTDYDPRPSFYSDME